MRAYASTRVAGPEASFAVMQQFGRLQGTSRHRADIASFVTHFGPEQPRFAVMHKRATLFPLDDDLGYRHSRDDFAYVSLAGGVIHQQAHPGIDNTLVIRT